jgi:hypothetical protein
MSQLFGYSLDRKKGKGSAKGPSFVHKDNDDAAQPIAAGGHFGQYVDLGDSANKSRCRSYWSVSWNVFAS